MRNLIYSRFGDCNSPFLPVSCHSVQLTRSSDVDVSTTETDVSPAVYSVLTDTFPVPDNAQGTAFDRYIPLSGKLPSSCCLSMTAPSSENASISPLRSPPLHWQEQRTYTASSSAVHPPIKISSSPPDQNSFSADLPIQALLSRSGVHSAVNVSLSEICAVEFSRLPATKVMLRFSVSMHTAVKSHLSFSI